MDKSLNYHTLLKQLLTEYVALLNRQPLEGADTELIIDETNGHYLIFNVGWSAQGRVKGTTLYIRLRDEKFWIEEDWTEEGFANRLVEAGVPKVDIVLAFHPPSMRPHTEFAIA